VRSNELAPETVNEINEIVTKNYLKQQKITYYKVPTDYIGKIVKTAQEETPATKSPEKQQSLVGGDSPTK
jgi:hypothetical protein